MKEKYKNIIIIVLLLVIIYLLLTYPKACKKKKLVYYFYKQSCPFCKDVSNEWDFVEKSFSGTNVLCKKIDISDSTNMEISQKFNVNAVPTIIKVDENDIQHKFIGTRKSADIIEWINSS